MPTQPERFGANKVPMRVRAGGLDLTGTVPGLLHAWARASDGVWLGLVSFTIQTGNRRGRLGVRQWCTERALSRPS